MCANNYVLGIAKAYTTRVGEGPFPSELHDEMGDRIREKGREFGTVTGRPRRCGWFDAVLVRRAAKIGGLKGLALMKLDVLDGLKEVKICVGYQLDGQKCERFPLTLGAQKRLEPIYEVLPGWNKPTYGMRSMQDLSAEAVNYIKRIEILTGLPVDVLSTSPEREDTIMSLDPFNK